MQIQWLGAASFRFQTKQSVLITDPFSDSCGLTMPKLKADVVVISNSNTTVTNNVQRLIGESFTITGAGEYEIKETFIYGSTVGDTTIYLVEDDGMRVAFLGALNSGLTNGQLEKIEGVDILLLPVGTLPKEQRTVLISQIEPRIIVPYLYKQPKLKLDLETIDVFLKEMGIKNPQPQDKLVLKSKDLPQEETTVVLLQPEA
ncbi:MAG: MBL fold metallo-hydrolase [Candidatus Kerfeldbacteria bacterium]|nr:MBL fold metallo-hydrolase [Candidatus Kerfeldbacteria bacterium]